MKYYVDAAAKAGGAVGAIVMNNGKDESIDDVDYVIEGGIGTLGMGMIEETLPCCSVSTDIGIRMLSLIYGIKMADAYDALVSERIYKEGLSQADAIRMVLNGECGSFNPKLLECFKNSVRKFGSVTMPMESEARGREPYSLQIMG